MTTSRTPSADPGDERGPGDGFGQGDPAGAGDGFGPQALRAERIAKRFGSVVALRDVTLHVRRGEVLGLIGDNGAGKSTLIKLFTGFLRPDSGQIHVNGEPVTLNSVQQARQLGIETVFQDLALVDSLPVYLNLHLNRELRRGPFLDKRGMRSRARAYLDDIGINIPTVNAEVVNLSGGQRQAIAVARSVYSQAKILLLDEPLAAMGAKEGAIILDLIRQLRDRGDLAIILVVHNYTQVMDICDRVCLLQHGEITFDRPTALTSVEELLDMVAREYRTAGRAAAARGSLLDRVRRP